MRKLLVTFAAALVWLAVAGSAADATTIHRFLTSFSGGESPFGPIYASAVDRSGGPSAGDVYVGIFREEGGSVVRKMTGAGADTGVEFDGSATPAGSFGLISLTTSFFRSHIAVDSSSGVNAGNVYIADIEHGVVDRFNEHGQFVCEITGLAAPPSQECNVVGGSATPDGSIEPTGVAIDETNGDVFVSDVRHQVIDEFGPSGDYLTQIIDTHIQEPGAIALDPANGDVYVENSASLLASAATDNVVKFHNGAFSAVLDEAEPRGIAVDPSTHHVYIFDGKGVEIAEYTSAGAFLARFDGEHSLGAPTYSLSVDGTGNIYTAEAEGPGAVGTINVLGPDVVVPTVSGLATSAVTRTGATVGAQVDPDLANGGQSVTGCVVEYIGDSQFKEHGEDFAEAQTMPCSPPTPYASATAVSATVVVSPSTLYHFRVTAESSSGATRSEPGTFRTLGPPTVEDEKATTLAATSATAQAQINPSGYDASCDVEYIDEEGFVASGYAGAVVVPCTRPDLGAGTSAVSVSAAIRGLQVGRRYHFRFVATNEAGRAVGADAAFATFGITSFRFEDVDQEGRPDVQAGDHPYEWSTSFTLSTTFAKSPEGIEVEPADANVKDVITEVPPGLIANPNATPRCPRYLVATAQCPAGTQVGVLEAEESNGGRYNVALYNVLPPRGVPGEFGAVIQNLVRLYIDLNVRTGSDYGGVATVTNSSADANIRAVKVTLWGVPSDPSHDVERICPVPGSETGVTPCGATGPQTPFLRNPTSCAGEPAHARMRADSWQAPGEFVSAEYEMPAMVGCDAVDFNPSVTVVPESSVADSPTGLHVELRVPQNAIAHGIAEADLKRVMVKLPVGVSVSPSAANGLAACTPAQADLGDAGESSCPEASKVGDVEIQTPLLADPVKGGVYVATQTDNPFHALLALYVIAEADGARIKLAGHVEADPVTGQLTTTFDDNPQLPFSSLKLKLFGGPRAALATPETCGTFTTSESLTPWSSGQAVGMSNAFSISSACTRSFAPEFTGGSGNTQAGAYAPFSLSLSRTDGEEELTGLRVTLPPGLLARLGTVPLCGPAEAATGTCREDSQIGIVAATAGAGPDPVLTHGKIYLTGPYGGGAFGEVVEIRAVAGPYDLGTVVVRGSIRIDPITAQATILSDPFPTIVDGIPLRIRHIEVTVNRGGFTINPTNCSSSTLAGVAYGAGGGAAALASHFQVGGCTALGFAPELAASTSGKPSKANGVGLSTVVSFPKASLGSQANVRSAKVQLPIQLPSRLSTLQQACLETTFNANPASCPAGSVVGHARVTTPLLNTPLEGPAYFVSHGGAAFPSLTLVLQGSGLEIDLVGSTFISKAGITTTTFKMVPDAPVTQFALTLPAGKHSALAGYGNLCKQALTMPTVFYGQNGAELRESPRIAVSGCSKHRKKLKRRTVTRRSR